MKYPQVIVRFLEKTVPRGKTFLGRPLEVGVWRWGKQVTIVIILSELTVLR